MLLSVFSGMIEKSNILLLLRNHLQELGLVITPLSASEAGQPDAFLKPGEGMKLERRKEEWIGTREW